MLAQSYATWGVVPRGMLVFMPFSVVVDNCSGSIAYEVALRAFVLSGVFS